MTEKREKILQNVGYVLLILAGEILYSLTVKLFLLPSGLITAGTTGIALVVNHYTGMSIPPVDAPHRITMPRDTPRPSPENTMQSRGSRVMTTSPSSQLSICSAAG